MSSVPCSLAKIVYREHSRSENFPFLLSMVPAKRESSRLRESRCKYCGGAGVGGHYPTMYSIEARTDMVIRNPGRRSRHISVNR